MRSRWGGVLLLVVLAVVVNLPLLHGRWTDAQVRRDGEDVTATVVDHEVVGSGDDAKHLLQVTFPRDVDPDERARNVFVDAATYDAAVASERLEVRVLPGEPGSFLADGERRGSLPLVVTLLADAVIVVLALLLWRFRDTLRRRVDLHLVATGDVERSGPGGLVDRLGDLWVVTGEVVERSADAVVLDVGDRRVRVDLAGHANPVGAQEPARVVGRLVG